MSWPGRQGVWPKGGGHHGGYLFQGRAHRRALRAHRAGSGAGILRVTYLSTGNSRLSGGVMLPVGTRGHFNAHSVHNPTGLPRLILAPI